VFIKRKIKIGGVYEECIIVAPIVLPRKSLKW